MVINYLDITNGFENKRFDFTDGFNQVYSTENSKGKSTLLRIMLHALGYSIPATTGFKTFDRLITKISVSINGKECIIERSGINVILVVGDDKISYILPTQQDDLHAYVYGINDILILDNILATYYIDQDKGWTLLNRGKIIGNNRFNIEDFIIGLSQQDVSGITLELATVDAEIKKYRFLLETAKYKKELEHDDKNILSPLEENQELVKTKTSLTLQRIDIEKEMKELDKVINKNISLITSIENMKLSVKDSCGNIILINKDNIENYNDNQTYLEARKKSLGLELTKINNQINKVEKELMDRNVLFNVKSVADEMDNTIRNMNIDYYKINSILESLTKRRSNLQNILDDVFANNNSYLEEIYNDVIKYATILGISERIPKDIKFILTRKLKGFSGKVLNQLTFSFKLAYINQINKKYGLRLPIIIDSLRNGELTDLAATKMLDILKDDFSEHQIIIASVYPYNICKNIITLENNLME